MIRAGDSEHGVRVTGKKKKNRPSSKFENPQRQAACIPVSLYISATCIDRVSSHLISSHLKLPTAPTRTSELRYLSHLIQSKIADRQTWKEKTKKSPQSLQTTQQPTHPPYRRPGGLNPSNPVLKFRLSLVLSAASSPAAPAPAPADPTPEPPSNPAIPNFRLPVVFPPSPFATVAPSTPLPAPLALPTP